MGQAAGRHRTALSEGRLRAPPPFELERMLRVYFLQQWYGLADAAIEDALYDTRSSARRFPGSIWRTKARPDATPLLEFRRLLETHDL